ncbi:Rieske (2Fe-2S) protein [Pseudonocardia sp. RS010]|uniref:Rieske (2Fe-2S) protein n=1 Tax=Pseudonocardia sp. RS010 TaxID=3385979 RepID=UPI0039A37BFC
MKYVVGPAASIPPGTSLVIYPEPEPAGIGVFNIDGTFFALRNSCPHMGAPLCKGYVSGTTEAHLDGRKPPLVESVRDGEILACPWHHWEFDIATGRTIFPSKNRVRRYDVTVEESSEVLERLEKGVQTFPVSVDGDEATVVVEI